MSWIATMETSTILLIVVIVLIFLVGSNLASRIHRLEAKVTPREAYILDDEIRAAQDTALASYQRTLDKLSAEKKALPIVDVMSYHTGDNWEAQLVAGAHNLRHLVMEGIYDRDLEMNVDQVPMTFNFAHELATLAHLKKDISIAEVEWAMKKIECVAHAKKHETDFLMLADGESELREIERRIRNLYSKLPEQKTSVWNAYREARKKEDEALQAKRA